MNSMGVSSTLLDRMVARVAEPLFTLAPLAPRQTSWGEEMSEKIVSPVPAVAESRDFQSERQAAPMPAPDLAPRIVTQVPEVSAADRAVPPLNGDAEAESPTKVPVAAFLRETAVVVPEVPAAPQLPCRAERVIPAAPREARAEMRFNLLPPTAGENEDVVPPVANTRRRAPQLVQPDLPDPLPSMSIPSPVHIQPEPVIHVTIGRLEVRTAERERKPRPIERAAVPGTTLEQYLAKRRGGGAS